MRLTSEAESSEFATAVLDKNHGRGRSTCENATCCNLVATSVAADVTTGDGCFSRCNRVYVILGALLAGMLGRAIRVAMTWTKAVDRHRRVLNTSSIRLFLRLSPDMKFNRLPD
ncbi:unnamed protein product [Allacma fusca]|uniref:Uncharacterized protein n=1 Tax=Allacma fusca TaxID=39272 RepID=A0A8J2L2B2_9HEXA|nr:unnamed protein product [Allacma fusca]